MVLQSWKICGLEMHMLLIACSLKRPRQPERRGLERGIITAPLVRVFLRLFSTGLACRGSLGEIRCYNEAVHTRRHRASEQKTEPSNSEVVAALLLQNIEYPLARRVPQLIGTFRRNIY
jgi:hypothetical protein